MVGGIQNLLPSSTSYVNTLDLAGLDKVAAVMTHELIATAIADVSRIVSLLCLPRLRTVEPSPWKVTIEGLVVDAMFLKVKVDTSATTSNVHALKMVRNAILSSAYHAMLGQ